MKLDHEEEPQLSEPYLSKQKKLMVSPRACAFLSPLICSREEDNWGQLGLGRESADDVKWEILWLAFPVPCPLSLTGCLTLGKPLSAWSLSFLMSGVVSLKAEHVLDRGSWVLRECSEESPVRMGVGYRKAERTKFT